MEQEAIKTLYGTIGTNQTDQTRNIARERVEFTGGNSINNNNNQSNHCLKKILSYIANLNTSTGFFPLFICDWDRGSALNVIQFMCICVCEIVHVCINKNKAEINIRKTNSGCIFFLSFPS